LSDVYGTSTPAATAVTPPPQGLGKIFSFFTDGFTGISNAVTTGNYASLATIPLVQLAIGVGAIGVVFKIIKRILAKRKVDTAENLSYINRTLSNIKTSQPPDVDEKLRQAVKSGDVNKIKELTNGSKTENTQNQ
jgi:hypothetical protein